MSRSISQCFWRVIIGQWLFFYSLLACAHVDTRDTSADIYLPTNDPGQVVASDDSAPNRPRDISGCQYDYQTPIIFTENWPELVRPLGRFAPDIGRHVIGHDLSNGHDEFLAMTVLTLMDGSERLLTGGYGGNGTSKVANTGEDFLLARFYPFGVPDPVFGSEGRVVMDFFQNDDRVWDILPLNDGSGRFLVAGSAHNAASTGGQSTGKDMVIMRFFEGGEVDTGFGQAGRVVRDFRREDDEIHTLALIEVDGNPLILAVGYGTHVINESSERDGVLLGITLAGEPAPGCSGDGVQAWDNTGWDDEFRSVTVVPLPGNTLRIIAGGYTTQSDGDRDFLLAGFSPDCGLDSGFGDDGIVRWSSDRLNTVWTVRTTGQSNNVRILVAGIARPYRQYSDARLELYRYLLNGTRDISFGSGGKTRTQVAYPENTPVTLELIHDNPDNASIMVGKYATMDCGEQVDLNALLNYHPNGSRADYAMGFRRFGEGDAAIRAIVNITGADGRRRLVVAGYGFGATRVGCGCSTQRDTILAGFMASGEPDGCFSADEQYLRGREECASLLPETIPTGKPIVSTAIPTATPVTATDPTPETDTCQCPSEDSTGVIAALSTLVSLALAGNVAQGITIGVFCYFYMTKRATD